MLSSASVSPHVPMSPCHLEGFAFAGRGATASRPFAVQVTMSRPSLSAFIISVRPRTPRRGVPTSYLPCPLAHLSTGQLVVPATPRAPTFTPTSLSPCTPYSILHTLVLILRTSCPRSMPPLPTGPPINGSTSLPWSVQPSLRASSSSAPCLPCLLVNLSTGQLVIASGPLANWPTDQLVN